MLRQASSFSRSGRHRLLAWATLAVVVGVVAVAQVAPAWARSDRDDDSDDRRVCRPGRISQRNGNKKANPPEFQGPVTTVCVGKHPVDAAIASYSRVLARDPENAEAKRLRAEIGKQ